MYQERLNFLIVIYLSHKKDEEGQKREFKRCRNGGKSNSKRLMLSLEWPHKFQSSLLLMHFDTKRVLLSITTGASVLIIMHWSFFYAWSLNIMHLFLLLPYTRSITWGPWIIFKVRTFIWLFNLTECISQVRLVINKIDI